MQTLLQQKYQRLRQILTGYGKVAVAFSGGVDSTFLLAVARDTLPGNVLALTARSCVLAPSDWQQVEARIQDWKVPHQTVELDFLAIPGVAQNPPDRCYLCKKELLKVFGQAAGKAGFATVVEGSNLDDLSDYRPGLRALEESEVESPLRDACLTKVEIRALSRELALPTAEKPSSACLASRIPYGETITEQHLQMVANAEDFLHQLGFGQVRVRYHSGVARIECVPGDFLRLVGVREKIVEKFLEFGFAYTALDLCGYRTGSLNETLGKGETS